MIKRDIFFMVWIFIKGLKIYEIFIFENYLLNPHRNAVGYQKQYCYRTNDYGLSAYHQDHTLGNNGNVKEAKFEFDNGMDHN